jgi:hypothetical protein
LRGCCSLALASWASNRRAARERIRDWLLGVVRDEQGLIDLGVGLHPGVRRQRFTSSPARGPLTRRTVTYLGFESTSMTVTAEVIPLDRRSCTRDCDGSQKTVAMPKHRRDMPSMARISRRSGGSTSTSQPGANGPLPCRDPGGATCLTDGDQGALRLLRLCGLGCWP